MLDTLFGRADVLSQRLDHWHAQSPAAHALQQKLRHWLDVHCRLKVALQNPAAAQITGLEVRLGDLENCFTELEYDFESLKLQHTLTLRQQEAAHLAAAPWLPSLAIQLGLDQHDSVTCRTGLQQCLAGLDQLQNDLTGRQAGQSLNALKARFERLSAEIDRLCDPFSSRLQSRCQVIIEPLLQQLQKWRLLDRGESQRSTSLAMLISHLLLTGRCSCSSERERFRRKVSYCENQHRLSCWLFQITPLNHFLLQALLGHPPEKHRVLGDDQELGSAARYHAGRNIKLTASGMVLPRIDPELGLVSIPRCRTCRQRVGLDNTCGCTVTGEQHLPCVESPAPRLVRIDSVYNDYVKYPMFRIRLKDGICRHVRGPEKTGASGTILVFAAAPVPLVEGSPQKQWAGNCPRCGKRLNGSRTSIHVKTARPGAIHVDNTSDHKHPLLSDTGPPDVPDSGFRDRLEKILQISLERPGDRSQVRSALRHFQEGIRRLLANRSDYSDDQFEKSLKELRARLEERSDLDQRAIEDRLFSRE
jgi:hypothetical protein